MAIRVGTRVTGLKSLERKLDTLEKRKLRRVLAAGTRAAMKVVLPAAKANTPKDTGRLRRSLRVRAMRRSRVQVGATIVSGKGKAGFSGDTYYGSFVEYGHNTRGGGRKVQGVHMLKRAMHSKRKPAVSRFAVHINKMIRQLRSGA